MEINVVNVNDGLYQALANIQYTDRYTEEPSRNGPVRVFNQPVMTTYQKPLERVLFSPLRDANPFFHFFEALWMLAGRNDVAFVSQFNKQIRSYSDDGETFHGAYGTRWRTALGYDQLAKELKSNPETRRAVLQMWDGADWAVEIEGYNPRLVGMNDLQTAIEGGKDVPCNTHVYFDVRGGKLNMTVCCRSNDLWWGCFGANAVHFSYLLEYMAATVGVPVGVYRQFSNNLHLYTSVVDVTRLEKFCEDIVSHDLYHRGEMPALTCPLVSGTIEEWNRDLDTFMKLADPTRVINAPDSWEYDNDFFNYVAVPMWKAWQYRKSKRYDDSLRAAEEIAAQDWRAAVIAWVLRREEARVAKTPQTA